MSRRNTFQADWLHGNVGASARNTKMRAGLPYQDSTSGAGSKRRAALFRVLIYGDISSAVSAIIYFHGGGWIVGSPLTHADISGELHVSSGLPVVSVDYGLAPEFKAVAAVSDSLAALSHFLAGNIKNAIICGDSAGASIALAVEKHADESLRKQVAGVCGLYGAFRSAGCNSLRLGSRASGLDSACVQRYWLLANGSRAQSPYSISTLASTGGCPVYLLVGGSDPLRDDTIALARALKASGREATIDILRYVNHGFLHCSHRHKARTDTYKLLSAWIRNSILAKPLIGA